MVCLNPPKPNTPAACVRKQSEPEHCYFLKEIKMIFSQTFIIINLIRAHFKCTAFHFSKDTAYSYECCDHNIPIYSEKCDYHGLQIKFFDCSLAVILVIWD